MNQHINIEDYLEPTDPPLPLPKISTFDGNNTINSTITLGETMITQGYRIPLQIKQGATTKTADIYIGSAPLTQGQTITKSQSNVDLELFSGDNIIDTTLVNKPQVDLTYRSSVLGVGEAVWIHGLSAPLRAIGDVKDTLDLSTGTLTRRIKKLVLTGSENWKTYRDTYYIGISEYYRLYDVGHHLSVCSHFPIEQKSTLSEMRYGLGGLVDGNTSTAWNGNIVFNPLPMISSLTDWKSYLAAQYAAGTPVTVWYALAEPETSTIPVPSGLSGAIKGYLIQDGTPTPETPIYPTANSEEDMGGTYKVFYSYQIPLLVTSGQQSTPYTIYIGSVPLTEGQSISKTSTGMEIALYQGENTISTTLGNKPEMRIDYESAEVGVGERTENLFDVNKATPVTSYRFMAYTFICEPNTQYTMIQNENMMEIDIYTDSTKSELLFRAYNRNSYTFNSGNHESVFFRVDELTPQSDYREKEIMLIKGSTVPDHYIPYGYQIPIDIKQGNEVVDHKDIYIGTQPLVEGASISKASVGEDITLVSGKNYIDAVSFNKPEMYIK